VGAKHAFRAKRFGTLYCVDVPVTVSRAEGRARVPVVVRVERGAPFRATLVPAGDGRHRVFLNGEVRAAAGLKLGNRVSVEVRVDRGPREVPIPPDLAEALREQGVREAWEAMPPGKREHILSWVEAAVHETTRRKRIDRSVEEALRKHEKRIDRGM
jgi:hypothetical protein